MSTRTWLPAMVVLGMACGPSRLGPVGDDDATDGGNNQGSGIGSSCATENVTAMSTPLDIYIMLDQSGSMEDDNKWDNVTGALKTFVQQPNLAGIAVGIQYFGIEQASNHDNDVCTVSTYATPEVEIAPLPGVATQIMSSINLHSPDSGTPTYQALSGAVSHAQSWAGTHPGDTVVVVLATDGEPDSNCADNDDVTASETIAQSGASGTPKVPTFVIGVGDDLSDLNGIAAAGGTGTAYVVDANANASSQFLAALNAIRGSALGCTYQIPLPTNGAINYQEVNIVYTPGGGSPQTIPQVGGASACPASGDAWYYDDPAAPMEIILCSSTCGTVEADTMGSLGITLGCQTVIE